MSLQPLFSVLQWFQQEGDINSPVQNLMVSGLFPGLFASPA